MEEQELKFEPVSDSLVNVVGRENVDGGYYEEDGAVYDSSGNPVPADKFVPNAPQSNVPKSRFVNAFTKNAKIPSGVVTVDSNGYEVNGKLNTDKSPMNDKVRDELSDIMGDDFVRAFSSGRAIENNKRVNITKIRSEPTSLPK